MANAASALVEKAHAELIAAKANLAKSPCYCKEIKILETDINILISVQKGLSEEIASVKAQQASARDKLAALFQGKKTTPYMLLAKPEQLQETIQAKYAALIKSLQSNLSAMGAQLQKADTKRKSYMQKDEKHHRYLQLVQEAQDKLRHAEQAAQIVARFLPMDGVVPLPGIVYDTPGFVALPGIANDFQPVALHPEIVYDIKK